jgi:para-aminobenzoate synthetase/4-amino-4-deoxychorismate lyase
MKGTADRGRWASEDEEYRNRLEESAKNRAENVMIVDLLRNDLGRVSVPGTVRVPRLFDVERYPTLFQMTSTIESISRPDTKLADLFSAVSVRVYNRRPQDQRDEDDSVSGAFSAWGLHGFNWLGSSRRRLHLQRGNSHTGAGYGDGKGCVWRGRRNHLRFHAEDEYAECLTKAASYRPAPAFQLIETRLEDGVIFWQTGIAGAGIGGIL